MAEGTGAPDQRLQKIPKEHENRRSDFEANNTLIRQAFVDLISAHKRKPTLREIGAATGLGIDTVCEHLKTLKFEPTAHPLRILTDDVLLAIFRAATLKKPSVQAQKLWLQVMEGYEEKTVQKLEGDPDKPLFVISKKYATPAPTPEAPEADPVIVDKYETGDYGS